MLHIGDNFTTDFCGARAAGMQALYLGMITLLYVRLLLLKTMLYVKVLLSIIKLNVRYTDDIPYAYG